MKKIIFLCAICVFAGNIFAQKETFDLATYTTPKGWKKLSSESAVQFKKEDEAKGTFCIITLFKAVPGTANSKENFDLAWTSVVKEMVTVSTEPEMQTVATENTRPDDPVGREWEAQSGYAPFEKDGTKGIVILVTSSGFEKMVNIIILTNTDVYEKEMTAFLESISLKKPEPGLQQNTTQQSNKGANTPIAASGSLTKYVWKSHQNRKDAMGNNAGYSTNSYQFYSNGTYKFSNTTFQYFTPKYYMVNEDGTYQITGNKIILKPAKSKFEVHQREKTDPVLKSGNFSLEVVQYSFEYATVYDRLRIVLLPVNGNETKRDGAFNYYVNGEKTKSYLYDAEEKLSIQTINTQNAQSPVPSSGGFTFTTTNFDNGWTSTVQQDWVEVTKVNIKVLIHYPNKKADAYNSVLLDGLKNAWNILVAPKYSSASNFEFKPRSGWESIEFAEADAIEKISGKQVYVVLFKKNYSNGSGKYLEFITTSKNAFENEFGPYHETSSGWEKMENLATYNKFAIAAADLQGKWTSDFTSAIQYVNAHTGLDAGMDTHASVENFQFGSGNTYKWDLGIASGAVGNIKFKSVKANGKFSVPNNWQITFSDIESRPRTYNAHFSCIKGFRILWLDNRAFGRIE